MQPKEESHGITRCAVLVGGLVAGGAAAVAAVTGWRPWRDDLYALSLGLTNGDLFTHCIAFSPGFQAPASRRGRIPVFVSHGVGDKVLPIDRCSRRIVPALRRDGYEVEYREFDGGHSVPVEQARAAVEWLAKS